jgi:NAD(P)H-flavin reductase
VAGRFSEPGRRDAPRGLHPNGRRFGAAQRRRAHWPSRAGVIRLGWGPDPVWSQLKIASITDAADGLKAITVDVPQATADGYTTGGQYVQLRAPGAEKASFIAVASSPGASGPFEFLVKEQPPSDWSPGTGWLTGAAAGDAIEMSQVMGAGFLKSSDALNGVTDVVLVAAGSGIAPIRATIESGALSSLDSVKLLYGCRTPAMMSYRDKFDQWKKSGVDVTPVISKPEGTGWDGATGYVQDAAKAAGFKKPASTAILLCGMKGMAEAIKELAAEAGVPEGNVLTNF